MAKRKVTASPVFHRFLAFPTFGVMSSKAQTESDPLVLPVRNDLIDFLLSAPTFTDEQLSAIADARELLSRWRTA